MRCASLDGVQRIASHRVASHELSFLHSRFTSLRFQSSAFLLSFGALSASAHSFHFHPFPSSRFHWPLTSLFLRVPCHIFSPFLSFLFLTPCCSCPTAMGLYCTTEHYLPVCNPILFLSNVPDQPLISSAVPLLCIALLSRLSSAALRMYTVLSACPGICLWFDL